MAKAAQYAYVQTRLQARHGVRLSDEEWRRLRSIGDLANYLQVAQRGPLNNWVVGIGANTTVHEIELLLRQRFREYIEAVSRWLGDDWRQSINWVKRLIDLPALSYILSGRAAPGWMLEDPGLKPFIHVNANLRDEAFWASDCRVFLQAWKNQEPLSEAWLREWKHISPLERHHQTGMEQLCRMFRSKLHAQSESPEESTELLRDALEKELRGAFRRLSGGPEIMFVHLGLVALDIERLRGDLVRMALFQVNAEAGS
jgi:hypothetical protein